MTWPAGETAFVTGGASGIGLGIARALLRAGANVALADINIGKAREEAERLGASGRQAFAVELDVSDDAAWAGAADLAEAELGPVSILCNNAGVGAHDAPLGEIPTNVWRWVFGINVDSQFVGVRTFLPRFDRRGGRKHILNTASMAGLAPLGDSPVYTAAKFASVGFSLSLREKFAGSDIGVSVLCPGVVNTPLARTAAQQLSRVTGEDEAIGLEQVEALMATGADPDPVGAYALEAMRDRAFFILTHPDWAPLTRSIQFEIEEANGRAGSGMGPDLLARLLLEKSDIRDRSPPARLGGAHRPA